ncbi:flagellar motor protein MotB [Pseudogemmobacter sonorensis]|uniref:flagellar motor protein MotB n=1 Tax=Pseudogemmobacter sonorensis TaxID=2989681 RepID=UPI0036C59424
MAYADFVTAMMAFFLLMWLLNATTETQRKGLSDYFNPSIPITRISGGGEDMFSGDSMFAQDRKPRHDTGGTSSETGDGSATAEDSQADQRMAEFRARVEQMLFDRGGESRTMQQLLRHVITRITDEGLVIELYDLENAQIFIGDSAEPAPVTIALAALLAEVLNLTANRIAVNAHVHSYPVTLNVDPSWDLTSDRAQAMRGLLERSGLAPNRVARVTGHADRSPAVADPAALRNNRIEIVLLRRDR